MKQKGLVQPEASLEELFINTSGAPSADEGIFATTSIFGSELKNETQAGDGNYQFLKEQMTGQMAGVAAVEQQNSSFDDIMMSVDICF